MQTCYGIETPPEEVHWYCRPCEAKNILWSVSELAKSDLSVRYEIISSEFWFGDLEEIESFIEEDENFNQYMKEKCKEDFDAFNQEKDFITFAYAGYRLISLKQ